MPKKYTLKQETEQLRICDEVSYAEAEHQAFEPGPLIWLSTLNFAGKWPR